ncbi:hypothetical protein LZ30DRAFT_453541 [Colletotrichum cereale]|nr:hypothetical protein LZ30DRAFT_453541 [Colletotrichum cereale]
MERACMKCCIATGSPPFKCTAPIVLLHFSTRSSFRGQQTTQSGASQCTTIVRVTLQGIRLSTQPCKIPSQDHRPAPSSSVSSPRIAHPFITTVSLGCPPADQPPKSQVSNPCCSTSLSPACRRLLSPETGLQQSRPFDQSPSSECKTSRTNVFATCSLPKPCPSALYSVQDCTSSLCL